MKTFLRNFLVGSGVWPNKLAWKNPFKIIEFEEVLKDAPIGPASRVLDFGCGTGQQTILIARKVKSVVGIDLSQPSLDWAKMLAKTYKVDGKIDFRCQPIEKAGFKSEFDAVVSFCVLEHIPDYRGILRQWSQALKNGGSLLLSVDALETITDPGMLKKHTEEGHVVKYFRVDEMKKLLEEAGFEKISIRPIFCSDYAKKLFEKGIDEQFSAYNRFWKLFSLAKLRLHEMFARDKSRGIFLCIRAVKKGD